MNYGERLKHARKLRGLTQYELSEMSGVSQQAISTIESGKRGTSSATIDLAITLSVDPIWLATGKGEPETKREYGNEKVPLIRGADVSQFINGENVKPVSHLNNFLLEGRPLFALRTTGIINFKNPLGQAAVEILVVNHSEKAIQEQLDNLEFLDPLHRIAIIDHHTFGVVPRILTPNGRIIILQDPAGNVEQETFDPNSDKILGAVIEIASPLGK